MIEPASPPAPTKPVPQAMPQAPRLLWLVVVLAVAFLGGSVYFLYLQGHKPSEKTSVTPPGLTTQESIPPPLTTSDSVADIEKDLSGTTIESGNSSEFNADLQSLQ